MKVLSIIPARGGSKGIPRKNIVNLNGKPLISWTIEASLASKYINKTIVSSEDKEILEISEEFGAIPFQRDESLAGDFVKTELVLLDVLNKLEDKFDYLVLLQATSPLRNSLHIDEAFKMLIEKNAKSLISVYEPDHSPLKAFLSNEDGTLKGIVNDSYPFYPRQVLPKTFYPNGAIYIIDVKEFLKYGSLFIPNKTIYYIMDKLYSNDIDTLDDLKKIEKEYSRKN